MRLTTDDARPWVLIKYGPQQDGALPTMMAYIRKTVHNEEGEIVGYRVVTVDGDQPASQPVSIDRSAVIMSWRDLPAPETIRRQQRKVSGDSA